MGCADHRISGVCHPYRTWGNVLHGNVGKGKKVKRNLLLNQAGDSFSTLE